MNSWLLRAWRGRFPRIMHPDRIGLKLLVHAAAHVERDPVACAVLGARARKLIEA